MFPFELVFEFNNLEKSNFTVTVSRQWPGASEKKLNQKQAVDVKTAPFSFEVHNLSGTKPSLPPPPCLLSYPRVMIRLEWSELPRGPTKKGWDVWM